jgi:hypothetical protein
MFLGMHRERHFPSCYTASSGGGGGSGVSIFSSAGSLESSGSGGLLSPSPGAGPQGALSPRLLGSPTCHSAAGAAALTGAVESWAAANGGCGGDGLAVLTRPPATAVLLAPPSMVGGCTSCIQLTHIVKSFNQ